MASEIEALRASMRSTQVYGKGNYFQEGRYLLEVIKCFYKRTFIDGSSKENIICEFKVVESSRPDVEVGSTRSVVFAFQNSGWLSRLKSMLVAIFGVDPDGKIPLEAEEAAADFYVALRSEEERNRLGLPENSLAGMQVRVEAIAGKSRKGTPVTNMKWTPVGAVAA